MSFCYEKIFVDLVQYLLNRKCNSNTIDFEQALEMLLLSTFFITLAFPP